MRLPAIHDAASTSSDASQKRFLRLVSAEYALLLAVSFGYLILPSTREVHVGLAILVIAALSSFWFRSIKKPDEDWYQFRALAESAKTLAWRFSMKAEPFDVDDRLAKAELRNKLHELLLVNKSLGAELESHAAEGDQVTDDMIALRSLSVTQRVSAYMSQRVADQRAWYAKKAGYNKSSGRRWFRVAVIAYGLLILVLLLRVAYPDTSWLSPDPLLVFSASVVGWIQVKKYNDLAAAYLLTAQEIGIVSTTAAEAKDETSLSEFVNNAELVFSREHTQWVARRRS